MARFDNSPYRNPLYKSGLRGATEPQNMNIPVEQTTATNMPTSAKQNWWDKMGTSGQQALFRAALAMGSSIMERTDPYARNPMTSASAGLLKGLAVHDTIKGSQAEAKNRSRLAEIGNLKTLDEKASALSRIGAETGNADLISKGLSLEERLRVKPEAYGILSEGGATYNKTTGIMGTQLPKTPAPITPRGYDIAGGYVLNKDTGKTEKLTEGAKYFESGGVQYKYDPNTNTRTPLTEPEIRMLPANTQILKQNKDNGEWEVSATGLRTNTLEDKLAIESAKGKNITDLEKLRQINKSVDPDIAKMKKERFIEDKIISVFGKRPQKEKNLGGVIVKNETYEEELRNYENKAESLRRELRIKYGLEQQQPVIPVSDRLINQNTTQGIQIPPEYKKDFDTVRSDPKNQGYSDQQILNAIMGK